MDLFPVQQDLVDILGEPDVKSRLIGDEMGIGKTAEAIGCDLRFRQACRGHRMTLIIAPRATHEDPWQKMIIGLTGRRPVVIDRKNRGPFINAIVKAEAEYFICHYEAMRLMINQLSGVQFLHVICDETHRIKNPDAQQTRAVKRLNTLYKTSMSGTPADNKPQDLWSTLNFLYPSQFRSKWRFFNQYCEIEEGENPHTGQKYRKPMGLKLDWRTGRPDERVLAELQATLKPFYMRRLKKDVLKDLPDKYYTTRSIELTPVQRRVYDDLKSEMLAWIGKNQDEPLSVAVAVAQLVRLQQAALAYLEWGKGPSGPKVRLVEPSAKLDDLVELLEDEQPLPIVLFSQSKSMIYLTSERLTKMGLRVATYTGDTPDRERPRLIEDYQAGKYDVFAGTIAAGGEGITLTAGSTVGFFDRAWYPRPNLQAEDRLHRIGQKNAVQVIDWMAKGTVDLRVKETNIRKWADLRAVLGDK